MAERNTNGAGSTNTQTDSGSADTSGMDASGEAVRGDVGALWRMLDLITPMALRVVATLRIADLIDEGNDGIDVLASRAGVDRVALWRVLRYLTAREVFREPTPGRFALTDTARLLLDADPSATRRWIDLDGFGGRMDLAFFDLFATVRDGHPPVSCDKATLPPDVAASYDTVMDAQSRAQAPAIVQALDWTNVHLVADIGGGTGTLLAAFLQAHPQARGTLLELPSTAATAQRTLAAEGVGDRCEVLAGDLFEVMPAGADVYILKFVLHFLEDAQAVTALRRCRDAGHAGSRIAVIESTVGPDEDRGDFTAMDLRMLILGHGRERTLDEYADLARQAGLRVTASLPTSTGLQVIELRRATGS